MQVDPITSKESISGLSSPQNGSKGTKRRENLEEEGDGREDAEHEHVRHHLPPHTVEHDPFIKSQLASRNQL